MRPFIADGGALEGHLVPCGRSLHPAFTPLLCRGHWELQLEMCFFDVNGRPIGSHYFHLTRLCTTCLHAPCHLRQTPSREGIGATAVSRCRPSFAASESLG